MLKPCGGNVLIRIGIGFDSHQLGPDRELIIGGVTIPHTLGSIGHSDGDALLHAITDAILGAAGLGDIGQYFPSDEAEWEGKDSRYFLRSALQMARENGFELEHLDSIVIIQQPQLRTYIDSIRTMIAETLGTVVHNVSVKATTTDGMGAIGEGQGWAAQAVVTLKRV